jgi:hypothetical protein
MGTWFRVSFQRLLCLQFTHCFFKTNFQPYPYFLSGLLIAVRWAFFIPTLLLYSLFSVELRTNAGVDLSFLKFLDHTQRRFTVSRTPLDEWSAGRRDLYLTHSTLTSEKHPCPWLDSNPRKRVAADLSLRLHDQWDRHICYLHARNNPPWIEHINNIWPTLQITKDLKGW